MPKTDNDIIKQLENEITMFLEGDFPMEEGIEQKPIFEERLKDLVRGFGEFEELGGALTYIRNGFSSWYTCILYPGMEPTNNLGEQATREHVILKKMIGCFRSEGGAKNYQY